MTDLQLWTWLWGDKRSPRQLASGIGPILSPLKLPALLREKRALEIEKRVMIFAYDARCVIDQAEGPELSLWRGRDLCPMNVDGRLD